MTGWSGPKGQENQMTELSTKDVYAIGYEHGKAVPANPASSEMAWADLRATDEEIPSDLESDYVRGHMAGQVAASK
jgi:hypothetical protein